MNVVTVIGHGIQNNQWCVVHFRLVVWNTEDNDIN
jgi:hypothetical protein